jgi:exopolysaccharide biosynthesis operon protein EpsL
MRTQFVKARNDLTPLPGPDISLGGAVRLLTLCVASATALPAAAQISDTIHPYAQASINHDDNLLRQADNALGEPSDTYKSVEAGLLFERPIGRQILTGRAKATRVTFDRYDQLNYNGKEVEGTLEWHIYNHLEGHIGANYSETLAPYVDFHVAERNLRVHRREFFDGAWLLHPSWKLRSAWSRDRYIYDLASQKINNRNEDIAEAGVDYLPSTTSSVGLRLRRVTGTYIDRNGFTSFFVDNGYEQNEAKANINWVISGASRLQFLGGLVRRKHAVFSVRDESGFNGRLVYDWLPRAKLQVNTAIWREFAAVEGSVLNSSLNKGGSLNVTYELSSKISATAGARTERRGFSAIPGVSTAGLDLNDSTRSASVGLSYAPLKQLRLDASAYHESRTGNLVIGTNSYKANGISLNVTAQF